MVVGYLVLSEIIRGEEQKKELGRSAGQQQERVSAGGVDGWVGGGVFVFGSVEMLFGGSSQQPADTLEIALCFHRGVQEKKNERSTRSRTEEEQEERRTLGGRQALWWRVFILRPLVSYQLNVLRDCFSTILSLLSPPSRSALPPLSSSSLPRCLLHL